MKISTFLPLVIFLGLCSIGYAQPELTLWRITDHDMHQQDETKGAEHYFCGTDYYLKHAEGAVNLHFDIKNEGDEPLVLDLPLTLSAGSSQFFSISEQPPAGAIAPGDDVPMMLTYTGPAQYVPDQSAEFVISSNAWSNPECSFSVETGAVANDVYCVCTENGPMTIDLNSGGFIADQDEIIIADQACETIPGGAQCPDAADVGCYIARNVWISSTSRLRSLEKSDFDPSEESFLQDGYCPCEIEDDIDICIDSPFDENILIALAREIQTRMGPVCPGEPFVVDTTGDCFFIIPELRNEINTRMPFTFEWDVLGFGTATPFPMGDSATISDWQYGDELVLKVFDPSGCMSVFSTTLLQRVRTDFLDLFEPDQGCDGNDYILCVDVITGGDRVRNSGNVRADEITWETDGTGTFTATPTIEGDCCIAYSGGTPGDRIVAIHNTLMDSNGCPLTNYAFAQNIPDCEFFVNENLLFIPNIRLGDPCDCSDPLNYELGGFYYFHDILTIETPDGGPGSPYMVAPTANWYDNAGNLVVATISGNSDANAEAQIDFWHRLGETATATVTSSMLSTDFTSSLCTETCPVVGPGIPTMGQWGIIVLAFLSLIIGIVSIKQLVPKQTF